MPCKDEPGQFSFHYRRDGQGLAPRSSYLLSLFMIAQCVPYGLDLLLCGIVLVDYNVGCALTNVTGSDSLLDVCMHVCAIPETSIVPLQVWERVYNCGMSCAIVWRELHGYHLD